MTIRAMVCNEQKLLFKIGICYVEKIKVFIHVVVDVVLTGVVLTFGSCFGGSRYASYFSIALFTVNFSHLHYPTWMRGNFGLNYKIARNCLTYMLDFNVIQISRVNREKGYCLLQVMHIKYLFIMYFWMKWLYLKVWRKYFDIEIIIRVWMNLYLSTEL